MAERLLEVNDLKVQFATEDGIVRAVDGISLELERGKVLGIVGESGSGKSVTAMTMMGLTRGVNARFEGEVLYKGTDLLKVSDRDMQNYRGNELGMIFQDPMTSLNPVYRIGEQIVEAIQAHENVDKRTARARTVELLRQVGIPNPETRVDNFPHEFSGGMRQRAMIAMALSCNPSILIADEPTTALDVTIQAQIVELIDRLKDDFDSARDLHHPRSRRDRRDRRRDHRHVRRPRRRAAARSGTSSTTRRCRTRGVCSGRSRVSTGRGSSACTRSRGCRRR